VEWQTQAWAASANMAHLDYRLIKQIQRSWEEEVVAIELAPSSTYQ